LNERIELSVFLKDRGVEAFFHYVPLHGSPAGKLYGRTCGTLEITTGISDCLLRLPLYYEMTEEDVQTVVNAIMDFYKSR